MAEEAKWYVVHTYSGYENKVKADIEKTIENRNLQEQILKVMIPVQTAVVEDKEGKKKQVQKKLFPCLCSHQYDYERPDLVCCAKHAWRDGICRTGF